jgi:hypothetical protein
MMTCRQSTSVKATESADGPILTSRRRVIPPFLAGRVRRIQAAVFNFWAWGIAFVSTNNGLNKSQVQWLEYALVKQATAARRCHLENGNVPQEPTLEDSEKAGTRIFLKEILRILPLAGLRALEIPKAIASPQTKSFASNALTQPSGEPDTIVVPAQKEGFEKVFLGAHSSDRGHLFHAIVGACSRASWAAVP